MSERPPSGQQRETSRPQMPLEPVPYLLVETCEILTKRSRILRCCRPSFAISSVLRLIPRKLLSDWAAASGLRRTLAWFKKTTRVRGRRASAILSVLYRGSHETVRCHSIGERPCLCQTHRRRKADSNRWSRSRTDGSFGPAVVDLTLVFSENKRHHSQAGTGSLNPACSRASLRTITTNG